MKTDLSPAASCPVDAVQRWGEELTLRDCETLWTLQPKVGALIQDLQQRSAQSPQDEEHLASAWELLRGLGCAQEAPYRKMRGETDRAAEQARTALQCLPAYEKIRHLLSSNGVSV